MSRACTNHGIPIVLDHHTFATFRERFAVVVMHERGVCIVMDDTDDSMMTFTQFRKRSAR